MSTLFPELPREVYSRSPLTEVAVEIVFPAILRIEATAPVEFQESVRERFPTYRLAHPGIPPAPPELVAFAGPLAEGFPRQYEFRDRMERNLVRLTKDRITVVTRSYTDWAGLRDDCALALAALESAYRPSYFTSIAALYVNSIDRTRLGLTQEAWRELLQPHIAGELLAPEVQARVIQSHKSFDLQEGPMQIQVRHGIPSGQDTYRLDITATQPEVTETDHALAVLDNLNRLVRNAFRWCITDRLRLALEPGPKPE